MWTYAASRTAIAIILGLVSAIAYATPIEMDDTDVRDFVRWYAQKTDTALAIDPAVDGTLTVYAPDVSDEALPDFFRGVLTAHGYRIVPGDPPTVTPTRPGDFSQALDTGPREPQATRVLAFDHLRAQDVAPMIDAYLNRATGQAGSVGQLSRASSQVLDAGNALLVSGDAQRITDLQTLLPQIDVSRPQVLIRAILFETNDGDTFDLGVALGRARSGAGLAGGVNTNALGTTLATPGGSFGIFDGNVLALAINALERNSQAKVLSTPQILTLSGQSGRISVGQNVPFVTGRVTGEAANIENPFQTIERRDVGVSLAVTPVVTGAGLVIMDVKTQADSLTDSLEASDIITNQRSIMTTVQIHSGQTVLLGGLVSEESSESVSSVPGLGSIPLIGRLFRNTSRSSEHRKLYVLLQATVLPTLEAAS
ncbi:secretin N-terminal domain-containing protein [Modicisalibacter radicis]|uniref:secretin N-terminal domain-containing protein n=1 Tax=Halomonas sp. EAR18 TaxID=2518972 RepID=UPI00109C9534|nr:secretin N-terminal domain-containing protein [Halomonas sp. EAR18]